MITTNERDREAQVQEALFPADELELESEGDLYGSQGEVWRADYESDRWAPHCYKRASKFTIPQRYVDGSATVFLMRHIWNRRGMLVPVVGASIGALALRCEPVGAERMQVTGEDAVEPNQTARMLVAFPVLGFSDTEVENLEADLRGHSIHLRRVETEWRQEGNFAGLRQDYAVARQMILREMQSLERAAAIGAGGPIPLTVVDGRVTGHLKDGPAALARPYLGVVKSHSKHPPATLQSCVLRLRQGERTPAALLESSDGQSPALVTWYVRMTGGRDSPPFYGLIRVEASRVFIENATAGVSLTEWIDGISLGFFHARSHASRYARAHCSLSAIVRLESILHARRGTPTSLWWRITHALERHPSIMRAPFSIN